MVSAQSRDIYVDSASICSGADLTECIIFNISCSHAVGGVYGTTGAVVVVVVGGLKAIVVVGAMVVATIVVVVVVGAAEVVVVIGIVVVVVVVVASVVVVVVVIISVVVVGSITGFSISTVSAPPKEHAHTARLATASHTFLIFVGREGIEPSYIGLQPIAVSISAIDPSFRL